MPIQPPTSGAELSICLLGLGGAGTRVVAAAARLVPGSVRVAAIDTDARALTDSSVTTKVRIGAERVGGLGCGGDAAMGRLCVGDEIDKLRNLFEGRRLVIVVTGLGGGTGSGGAAALLRAARSQGSLTLCLALYPFGFEGSQRQGCARAALEGLHAVSDGVVVMAQDRLLEQVGDGAVAATFERADGVLAMAAAALCKLLVRPGYVNLSFADLEQLLKQGSGSCTLGFGRASGAGRAAAAVSTLLEGPLLEQGHLVLNARAMLVGILGGPDLAVRELAEVMTPLRERAGPDCLISMGTFLAEGDEGVLTVVALVAEAWMESDEARTASARSPADGDRRRKRPKASSMKDSDRQALLSLDQPGKGRFKNVAPTILDGEDIDVPTYVRRGIDLDR